MKNLNQYKRAFGIDEFGFVNLPTKYSNIKISRITNTANNGDCTYCFPHGIETRNSHYYNSQRNWKRNRKTKWKNN